MTSTYAYLTVSPAAYNEIATLLLLAGYKHALLEEDECILMDGLALITKGTPAIDLDAAERMLDDTELRAKAQDDYRECIARAFK